MLREELIQKTLNVLENVRYEIAQQISPSCFDILARKGKQILLIKILTNVDSFYEDQSDNLKRTAKVLNAFPILVGLIARSHPMHERTLYERYGIPAVSVETFAEAIQEQKFPFIYTKKGGFYAHLNSDFLKKIREQQNFSLAALAREAGISKTSLQNYERGEGAEVETILRLQEALGDLVLEPLNLFTFKAKKIQVANEKTILERSVRSHLDDIGFKTTTVSKASFRMIGKHRNDILLTGLKKTHLEKKAEDIHSTADALNQHGMFVLRKTKKKSISGVPILEKEEFKEVVTSKELLKLLKELSEV